MDDLISRQAAINALAKLVPYAIYDESTESYTNGLTDAHDLICLLPSAQPELTDEEKRLIKKLRSYHNGSYAKVIDKLLAVASAQPERKKGKCPICKYPFEDCQCRFAGSAHPDRSKRARVVVDHIYLLTDAQIEHLKKVQEWWQTSYYDEEMNRILNELKGEEE